MMGNRKETILHKIKNNLTGPYKNYLKYVFARGFLFRQMFNKKNSSCSDYLSIAIIIKNEAPYIREWIEYHLLVGVDRFYVYDIESTDNVLDILQPYIDMGVVIYQYFPGKDRQVPAYCDAILKYKYHTRWLAFVDADEFIVPVQKYTLPEVLRDYEHYPGIGINYAMYDSNGHIKKPNGLVIKNYTNRSTDPEYLSNRFIKSIVNPREVIVVNAHWCLYRFFKWGVDENGENTKGAITKKQSIKKLRINHYYTKSKEELLFKINKGAIGTLGRKMPDKILIDIEEERYNFLITREDRIMDKYIDEVEEKIH
ncbi:hypothetical protein McpSp1_07930 [Methanocorpusculaceae archaeon Sp1]|nr:hypothetical protein [Methanocorpusculaceae archaeon Sp1]